MGPYQVLSIRDRVDLGAMAMKGVPLIPQSSSITGNSPSDCLVSYPEHSLVGVLPLCRGAVGILYSHSRLGNFKYGIILRVQNRTTHVNLAKVFKFAKLINLHNNISLNKYRA